MKNTYFFNEVLDRVNDSLPEGTNGILMKVTKNNGVVFNGITIRNQDENIAPTIYLDGYKKDVEAGVSTIDEIVSNIIRNYENSKCINGAGDSFAWFSNYDEVKKKVVCRVVNAKLNRDILNEIPYIPFLDLAITFCVMVSVSDKEDASILVRNQHMEIWNADEQELFSVAKENTKKLLPTEISSMASILSAMANEPVEEKDMGASMYVLTNRKKMNGGTAVLDAQSLAGLAEKVDDDLWLLPSSIHEWIALPSAVASDLETMIVEVNATQLEPQEVLSDHPYFYSRNDHKVMFS